MTRSSVREASDRRQSGGEPTSSAPDREKQTLTGAFSRIAAAYPEVLAAVVPTPAGASQVTYRELEAQAAEVAAGLQHQGLVPGDVIAIWLPNCIEWLVLELAAAQLGLVVVGVNTRYRADDARYVLKASGARLLVMATGFMGLDSIATLKQILGSDRLPDGEAASPDLPSLTRIVAIDFSGDAERLQVTHTGAASAVLKYADLIGGGAPTLAAAPDRPLNLLSTSGTTGSPKLVTHTHDSLVARFVDAGRALDVHAGDVTLVAVPVAGAFGLGITLTTLLAGATAVLVPGAFDPPMLADLMVRYGVTHFQGGDDMVEAVLKAAGYSRERLGRWRHGFTGNFTNRPAAGMVDLLRAADAVGVTLCSGYGCSEALTFITSQEPDASLEDRAVGGGHPIGGTLLRVADPDDGRILPHRELGEIQLSGPSVMAGYWRNPEATATAFTPDGWLRTGDIGHVQADGRLVYSHRLKDAFRLRGYMVDPRELEDLLARHDAVASAQVVAIPGKAGDRAVAFVILAGGQAPDAEELLAFCRSRVATYKVPHHIAYVDSFPMGDGVNGPKILKDQLRERAIGLFFEA
jgi:fatty-acyl-CoA synthase